MGWKAVLWKWNNCLVFRLYKGNENWGRRIWRWITNYMRVLMKVTPGNSTTDQLLVRSWPQLRSSSCDWYYLHYTFLLGPLTRAQCLQEKQKNHRPDTISDTHMLCSFPSFIYDLSSSFTQCNLNSNSLKNRFHMIRGLMNHVLLLLLLPPTLN